MKLVFAGTPAFALPTLQTLHAAGHTVLAVYTRPDRPAGRGRKTLPSPVKQYALTHGLRVSQPVRLAGEEDNLRRLEPDVMVVVAYGLLLPATVLGIPRHGCLNVHASLLPRWRGAAPVARAIEAGDAETGITIMQMEAGLDTGPILLQRTTAILETDTAAGLEQRLAQLGADALGAALELLSRDELTPRPQDRTRACYAPKLDKAEAVIDWSQPASVLHRKIRALHPWPVASTVWRGQALRLWNVAPLAPDGRGGQAPGAIVAADAAGLQVQTGSGVLTVTALQAPGGRVLPVGEFLHGARLRPGERLGA